MVTKCITKSLLAAVVAGASISVQAGLIDDFEADGLGEYTSTVILDANGGGSNTSVWSDTVTDGSLTFETSAYDGIEQVALIRTGLVLAVGDEVQADFSTPADGNRNFGLYVGGTAPTTGVRQDYITVYTDPTTSVIRSRGFDGTTEYNNPGNSTDVPATATLFIARSDTNEYEAGYYDSSDNRVVVTTRTPATANTGDYVGFYADVRAQGSLGTADNFRVVPEPTSLALLGLGGLLVARRRRD